jgi:SH3-like domain-containing protein
MIIRMLPVLLLVLFLAQSAMAEFLSVKGDNVNLRTKPDTLSPVKWEYGKGFPLKVLERKGEWVKVADFEEDTGWINRSLLSSTPHVIVNVNKNSKKSINIRQSSSLTANIVGKAYYGVVFQRLEVKSGWVKVRHESGLEGWVKATLLWGN